MLILTSRCKYCGRELPTANYALPSHRPMLITLPCDCEQAKEEQAREQRRIDREEISMVLREVWDRSNVPPRFSHVSADFDVARPLFDGRWLYICGKNGRGKTRSACQAAKAYLIRHVRRDVIPTPKGDRQGTMRCDVSFHFTEAQGLLSEVTSSWDTYGMSEAQVKSRWAGVDLLILDDFGKGVPSEWAAETLFDILNRRWAANNEKGQRTHKDRLTIITSQYEIGDIAERYKRAGNGTLSAMVSRLDGECEVRRIEGPDRRTAT